MFFIRTKTPQLLFLTSGNAFSTTASRWSRCCTIGRFLTTACTGAHSIGARFYWFCFLSCKNRFIVWWCWVSRHVDAKYFLLLDYSLVEISQKSFLWKNVSFNTLWWVNFTFFGAVRGAVCDSKLDWSINLFLCFFST